jgi:hypothetical protein
MLKVFTRYLGRSISITAAIALTLGTVYLSSKGEMEAAMGAAGAAVAAFTASGGKEQESEDSSGQPDKQVLDHELRIMMLELAAQSQNPELLERTIKQIIRLQEQENYFKIEEAVRDYRQLRQSSEPMSTPRLDYLFEEDEGNTD